MAENTDNGKPKWFSIKEAAEYLEVGEPTIYRWMRDGKITFRKVGDSTRFLKADLDAMVELHPSSKEAASVRESCPACHADELVDGTVRSTGLVFFQPKKTKFWTFRVSNIGTAARMCARCGCVTLFGDTAALAALRVPAAANKEKDEV